jgi:hypothetical protein
MTITTCTTTVVTSAMTVAISITTGAQSSST